MPGVRYACQALRERPSKGAGTAAAPVAHALLTRPVFLAALGLLLLNDLYLKTHASSWLTGKLSDFAGLFVFAVFWTSVAHRYRRAIHIGTAVAFLLWKSPVSDPTIAWWNALGLLELHRVVDYTDWAALLVLPASYRHTAPVNTTIGVSITSLGRRFARSVVSVVSLTAMIATSRAPQTYHVVDWNEDGTSHSRSDGSLHLALNDVSISYSPSQVSTQLVVRNAGTDTVVLRGANLASGRNSYSAELHGRTTIGALAVAPGAAVSVNLSWEMPYSGDLVEPASIWLRIDVGDSRRVVRALLSYSEIEAHSDRRRARTARLAGAIFLSGLLAALIVRRLREETLGPEAPTSG